MDSAWALEVMRKAPYITVSFIDADGKAYGLPLSLATDDNEHWYFHGALEGKKLDAIKAHPEVCLSAVTKCAPTIGPKDGSFTLQYKSAIAFGKAVESGQIEVVNIMIGDAPKKWDADSQSYSSTWIVGASKEAAEKLDLRMMPCIYILDENLNVIAKNKTVDFIKNLMSS